MALSLRETKLPPGFSLYDSESTSTSSTALAVVSRLMFYFYIFFYRKAWRASSTFETWRVTLVMPCCCWKSRPLWLAGSWAAIT